MIDLPKMTDIDITAQELLNELQNDLRAEERQEGEITASMMRDIYTTDGKRHSLRHIYNILNQYVDEGILTIRKTPSSKVYYRKVKSE